MYSKRQVLIFRSFSQLKLMEINLLSECSVCATFSLDDSYFDSIYEKADFYFGSLAYMFLWESSPASPEINHKRWQIYKQLHSNGILSLGYAHYDEIAKKY